MKKETLIELGLNDEQVEKLMTDNQKEIDEIVTKRLAREAKKHELEISELKRKNNETIEDYEMRIQTAGLTAEEKYKVELEQANKKIAEKEQLLKNLEITSLRKSILAKNKLSDKFLNRISGETEQDIEASVKDLTEAISEYNKSQIGGTPRDLNGGQNGGGKIDPMVTAFDNEMKKL